MSDIAHVGTPEGPIVASNITQFLFSNPFTKGGDVEKCAPTPELSNHHIPTIPREKPLLVDTVSGAQISWRRTQIDALRVAAGLQSLGLQPSPFTSTTVTPPKRDPIVSPVVLVHLPNCLAFAPILYGVFASGLTATLANPALTSGELAWVLKNAKPQAVITTPQGWPLLEQAIKENAKENITSTLAAEKNVFIVDPLHEDYGTNAHHNSTLPGGARDWKVLLSATPLSAPVHFSSKECRRRAALILWSSGTSGRSKGVVLSHYGLCLNMHVYWHANPKFGSENRWLGFAPFYHIFGLTYILLLAPCLGATVFVMPKFDPVRMLQHIQDYRVNLLHMAPPVGVLLAKSPMLEGYDLSSLGEGISGGAPFPPEIIEMIYKRLGFLIKLGYGLSEAGSVCNQFGDSWDTLRTQLGNTGPPMYGVEIKVVSLEDGTKTLKRDQEGEILIKSGQLLNCYLNNKEATEESLDAEGWFRTGDVGKVDRSGYIWITDRLKEVIKVKGFQVSPSELENILCGSPLVADAAVAAVYNSAQATELPRAYVVPSDPALLADCAAGKTAATPGLQNLGEQIKKLTEEKLAKYKWLQGNIVFVNQIPKSPAGKILRRLLKDTKGVEVALYQDKAWQAKPKL